MERCWVPLLAHSLNIEAFMKPILEALMKAILDFTFVEGLSILFNLPWVLHAILVMPTPTPLLVVIVVALAPLVVVVVVVVLIAVMLPLVGVLLVGVVVKQLSPPRTPHRHLSPTSLIKLKTLLGLPFTV